MPCTGTYIGQCCDPVIEDASVTGVLGQVGFLNNQIDVSAPERWKMYTESYAKTTWGYRDSNGSWEVSTKFIGKDVSPTDVFNELSGTGYGDMIHIIRSSLLILENESSVQHYFLGYECDGEQVATRTRSVSGQRPYLPSFLADVVNNYDPSVAGIFPMQDGLPGTVSVKKGFNALPFARNEISKDHPFTTTSLASICLGVGQMSLDPGRASWTSIEGRATRSLISPGPGYVRLRSFHQPRGASNVVLDGCTVAEIVSGMDIGAPELDGDNRLREILVDRWPTNIPDPCSQ